MGLPSDPRLGKVARRWGPPGAVNGGARVQALLTEHRRGVRGQPQRLREGVVRLRRRREARERVAQRVRAPQHEHERPRGVVADEAVRRAEGQRVQLRGEDRRLLRWVWVFSAARPPPQGGDDPAPQGDTGRATLAVAVKRPRPVPGGRASIPASSATRATVLPCATAKQRQRRLSSSRRNRPSAAVCFRGGGGGGSAHTGRSWTERRGAWRVGVNTIESDARAGTGRGARRGRRLGGELRAGGTWARQSGGSARGELLREFGRQLALAEAVHPEGEVVGPPRPQLAGEEADGLWKEGRRRAGDGENRAEGSWTAAGRARPERKQIGGRTSATSVVASNQELGGVKTRASTSSSSLGCIVARK